MTLATQTINDMLTPNLLHVLAAQSGLPEPTVRRGIDAGTASILDGLAVKARDPVAMNQVVELVERTPEVVVGDRFLDDRTPVRESSSALLGIVTPDSTGMVSRLARSLGVGAGAAAALLTAAASLAIAGFRKIGRAAGGLTAPTLATSLLDGRSYPVTGYRAEPASTWREEVAPRSRAWMLLLLIPLALIGYWLWQRGSTERFSTRVMTPSVTTPTPAEKTSLVTPPPDLPEPSQPVAEPSPAPTEPLAMTEEPSPAPAEPLAMTEEPSPGPSEPLETAAETSTDGVVAGAATATGEGDSTSFEVDVVEFPYNSSTIPPEAEPHVASIAQVLQENPSTEIEVAGYTDATGSREYNDNLAKERAESLRQALIEKGIDEGRIETTAHGEENKAVETENEALVNRRAVVRVSSR